MNEYLAAEQSRNKSMIPYSLTQGISFSGSQSASPSEFLIQMTLNIKHLLLYKSKKYVSPSSVTTSLKDSDGK